MSISKLLSYKKRPNFEFLVKNTPPLLSFTCVTFCVKKQIRVLQK